MGCLLVTIWILSCSQCFVAPAAKAGLVRPHVAFADSTKISHTCSCPPPSSSFLPTYSSVTIHAALIVKLRRKSKHLDRRLKHLTTSQALLSCVQCIVAVGAHNSCSTLIATQERFAVHSHFTHLHPQREINLLTRPRAASCRHSRRQIRFCGDRRKEGL
jgi:hypothetical protein